MDSSARCSSVCDLSGKNTEPRITRISRMKMNSDIFICEIRVIRGQLFLYAENVVAAVDVDDFAGNPARQRTHQEHRDVTNFVDIDGFAQWSALSVQFDHARNPADSG